MGEFQANLVQASSIQAVLMVTNYVYFKQCHQPSNSIVIIKIIILIFYLLCTTTRIFLYNPISCRVDAVHGILDCFDMCMR